MKKDFCKTLSLVLTAAMVISTTVSGTADAKKAVKLSKTKLSIKVGEKKTIKVKNSKKKAKWTIKSGKKNITLSKKKKSSVVVKGKKAGKATVQAKVAGKKLKCTVTVKKKDTDKKTNTPTPVTDGGKQTPTPATDGEKPTPTATATATAPDGSTSTATPEPSQGDAEKVEDVVIDLTDIETTFYSSPAMIDFSDQIESRFDLSLYSRLEVGYELEFEDDDMSDYNIGKIGIAQTDANLNGYDDGVAFSYGMSATGTTATVDLVDVSGTVVGINIQPMNDSYAWPANLNSVTITSIEFVAKPGAVYPDPNAPTDATPTPGPTFPPTTFTYEGTSLDGIDKTKPMVAFTFDDGPIGNAATDNSMKIQSLLKKYKAHASFFYIGGNINSAGREDEIRQAKENGFDVGNHSWGWSSLNTLKEDGIKDSIGKTNAKLTELTGYENFLFRAPNLAYSKTMYGYINAPFIDCSVDSQDWNKATVDQIIENVKKAKDGDIVLMHETENNTAEALETLLKYFIEDQGFEVVSVTQLFAAKGKTLTTGQQYKSAK